MISELRVRFRALFRRQVMDAELEAELRDHLRRDEAQLAQVGLAPAEASRQARARFGALDAARDGARDERGLRWIEDAWRDLRRAWRSLVRRPLYALTACITLGLGMAATTSIYSLVSLLLLRPLDADRPGQLVVLGAESRSTGPSNFISYPTYRDIAALTEAISGAIASSNEDVGVRLAADAVTEPWLVHASSGNYFEVLGLKPALGRFFTPEEEERREQLMVLGYAYWQTRFGGDRNVIGRSLIANGAAYTVIGVAPKGWHGLETAVDARAYVPLRTLLPDADRWGRNGTFLRPMVRLREGRTLEDLRAALGVVAARIAPELKEQPGDFRFLAEYERKARPVIVIAKYIPAIAGGFLSLAVLALLIACVNVGNLVLSRTMARSGELAVRRALGASRRRVARELLSESLLLGIGAFVVALPIIYGIVGWFANLQFSSDLPVKIDARVDASVLGFSAGVALLAGLVTGLAPAMRGSAVPALALRESTSRAAGTSKRKRRLGSILLAGQLAFSLVLIIAGALFVRSLQSVTSLDLGVVPEGVAMASVDLSLNQYSEGRARSFFRQAEEDLGRLPGVQHVGLVRNAPMGYSGGAEWIQHPDHRAIDGAPRALAGYNTLTPGAFKALGMRLVSGRAFDAFDDSAAPHRVLVNEELARLMWPGVPSVLGQRLLLGNDSTPAEVVGVVRRVTAEFPTERRDPQVLQPYTQVGGRRGTFYLRVSGPVDPILPEIRRVLRNLDPTVAMSEVNSMYRFLHEGKAFLLYRVAARLTMAIGAMGVLQTLVGLYGVIAFGVAQRRREFGVRLALGATRSQLVGQIMRSAALEIGVGGVAGTAVAAGLLPMVGSILAVSPRDPAVYAGCLAGLVGLAFLSVYLPSRRATRLEAAQVLRSD